VLLVVVDDEVLGGLVRLGISGTGLKELGALWICAKQNPGATINDRGSTHDFAAFIGPNLAPNIWQTQVKLDKSENEDRANPDLVVNKTESMNGAGVFAMDIIGTQACPQRRTRMVKKHDVKTWLNQPIVVIP
jgi:hypothetical protein